MEPCYFVHDGYLGCAWGSVANPHPVTDASAKELMRIAGLTHADVTSVRDLAQYAEKGDALHAATGGNRFLTFGEVTEGWIPGRFVPPAPIDLTAALADFPDHDPAARAAVRAGSVPPQTGDPVPRSGRSGWCPVLGWIGPRRPDLGLAGAAVRGCAWIVRAAVVPIVEAACRDEHVPPNR